MLTYAVRVEISKAQKTINRLVKFKKSLDELKYPTFFLKDFSSNLRIFTKLSYKKTGFRYEYTYNYYDYKANTVVMQTKTYKSINRILHDLKLYVRYLQKTYIEAVKFNELSSTK